LSSYEVAITKSLMPSSPVLKEGLLLLGALDDGVKVVTELLGRLDEGAELVGSEVGVPVSEEQVTCR